MKNHIKYFIYVDEVEFQKTPGKKQTFYFFGALIPCEKIELIEKTVLEIIAPLGKKGFHAKKTYKNMENWNICEQLNKVLIENYIQIICFPFVQDWIASPRLVVLKEFEIPDFPRLNIKNYRSQAWFLFLHVLNGYINKKYSEQFSVRAFFDKDWLKVNEVISHDGQKLNRIENVISTKSKDTSLLILADHIGYLFNKLKRNFMVENTEFVPIENGKTDTFIINAHDYLIKITNKNLFKTLDLWEWIDEENKNFYNKK